MAVRSLPTRTSTTPVRCACLAALLALVAGAPQARAQVRPPPPPGTERVRVVPGATYAAGGIGRALLGDGYRALWTTPIEVPVVDLDRLGGGVSPRREGGGVSTRTLHLDGADGRRYVFRSVDKSPRELLEDFAGSPLASLIQDQMSAFHPSAAPVVARLVEEVGVLHTEPELMVVPDDPRLGAFYAGFAGLLVVVEERPSDGMRGATAFAGSHQVLQTHELFRVLEADPDHRVAAEELLRSRLVDILVGDRDRSHNNHLWARFDDPSGGFVWRVIPRDRDQAFVRFTGPLLRMARAYDARFVPFTERYLGVRGLTRNAWDIDRTLLVGLDRTGWARAIDHVRSRLTNDVIDEALAKMPPEHHALVAADLRRLLRSRRDRLDEAAAELYDIVFRYADVPGTDRPERLRVLRSGSEVRVTLITQRTGRVTFDRIFSAQETEEVRVYLRGGDDEAVFEGSGAEEIVVRVVGGGGRDRFTDRTTGPIGQTVVYDAGERSEFPASGAIRVERRAAPRPYAWWFDERTLDWGTSTLPAPAASYDLDRGLVLVAGVRHDRYGFLKRPYASRTTAQAGWAFGRGEPIVSLRHRRRDAVRRGDVALRARWSGAELLNYFGFGNETDRRPERAFHRMAHRRFTLGAALSFGDEDSRLLEVGPLLRYTHTDTTGSATLVAQQDPYGTGAFTVAGLEASFTFDGRDAAGAPRSGTSGELSARVYPALFDASRGAFGGVRGVLSQHVSPPGGNPVLGLRAAAEQVWGPYPVTEAAFLGGSESLRGVNDQRYAGDASLLGTVELRVELGRIFIPMRTDVGVLSFVDVGRVWLEGERSSQWHSGVGGGVWFALVDRTQSLRVVVARSGGRFRPYAGLGFAF